MAATIAVACPQCQKVYRAAPEAEGKKLRCKECGTTFRAVATAKEKGAPASNPAKAASPPAPPKVKAAPSSGKRHAPEDEPLDLDQPLDTTPYGVTGIDLLPRCPNCTHELDDHESIICMNCGFNSRTRQFLKVKKTIANTAKDRMEWLMPGIFCLAGALLFIGVIAFLWVGLPAMAGKAPTAWWTIFDSKMAKVWGTVLCLFVIYFTGRFAFHRLLLHPEPPEFEIKD